MDAADQHELEHDVSQDAHKYTPGVRGEAMGGVLGVSSSPYTWGQFLENDPWSPAHQPRKPFIHSHAPPIISATVGFGSSQSQS